MKFVDRKGRSIIKPVDKKVAKRVSAYGLYIDKGRILLVKTTGGSNLWELPGGGLKSHESLIDGLKREFLEETGCIIKELDVVPLLRVKENFYADNIDRFYKSERYFFRVKKAIKHGEFKDKSEVRKVARLRYSQINAKNVCADPWRVIKKFLEVKPKIDL